ncbi:hypothetical protein GQ44DRAFT_342046 [Phaeosphaeriaceae sp. PMI808]|nr:hypothetical protein GQ44DRAFT_342046 [Phaeosphaeriaceae sp. PMI808]
MDNAPDDATLALKMLKDRFDGCNDLNVFRHCAGMIRINFEHHGDKEIDRVSGIAEQLAAHTILVCIDTEHYTLNSDEMTEVGIATFARQNVAQISDYGDHGDNLMRQSKFHFFRLREKAHLPTTNVASRGPEGNRFGEARFVTFKEMRTILHQLFVQPIIGAPDLEGFYHPVVILGHSVGHDCNHLNGKDLKFDVGLLNTIVKHIDTQQMALQSQYWTNRVDDIGLNAFCLKLGFEHRDAHTASNDAARTLMCAMYLVTPKEFKKGRSQSLQQVADSLEPFTRNSFIGLGGSPKYCIRCGSTQHLKADCTATDLNCAECATRGLLRRATTHIIQHCLTVADEVKDERLAWYEGQKGTDVTGRKTPKIPFKSRLQTFAENAPIVPRASTEEVSMRLQWYNEQQDHDKPKPFTSWRRSFQASHFVTSSPDPAPAHTYYPTNNASGGLGSSTWVVPSNPSRGGSLRGGILLGRGGTTMNYQVNPPYGGSGRIPVNRGRGASYSLPRGAGRGALLNNPNLTFSNIGDHYYQMGLDNRGIRGRESGGRGFSTR